MKYALMNVTILDGSVNMTPKDHQTVLVDDERIVKIGEISSVNTDGYQVYDLTGKYLLPGLINLHVHMPVAGKAIKKNAKPVNYKGLFDKLSKFKLVLYGIEKMEQKYAKQELLSGVTTLRAVGGILNIDGRVRDKINAGMIDGPRMLVANTAISVPGGHFAGSLATEAGSVDEVKEHVKKIAKTNPNLIKLMITGGVMDATAEGEPGALRMPADYVKAACEESHKRGLQVAAHVESAEGVRVALENGVDTIEHGAEPNEEIIAMFKKQHAAHICTISPALPYAILDESISHAGDMGRKNGSIVMNGIINCAKACLTEGITVGIGTDTGCPFITHYDMWRELWYFSKYCNVSAGFAIATATSINAKILGLEKDIGTVEEGKRADLIVADENPLEDLRTLRKLYMVIANGKIHSNIHIKKMEDVEKALDSALV